MKTLDHVAIAVWDSDSSIQYYVDKLGFKLIEDERLEHVRLVYLDAGNTMIQLVQPLKDGPIKDFLIERGEGLHHICLGVPNIPDEIHDLGIETHPALSVGGRGRLCCFLPNQPNGVSIELTEHEPYQSEI